MKHLATVSMVVMAVGLFASTACADGISVVRAQFTDRVEHGQPVGDANAAIGGTSGVYWMEVNNTGAPSTVTVVWKIDGREVGRQSLDVGHAPRWRTWGSRRLHGAHEVEVSVLDPSGNAIHTDHIPAAAH